MAGHYQETHGRLVRRAEALISSYYLSTGRMQRKKSKTKKTKTQNSRDSLVVSTPTTADLKLMYGRADEMPSSLESVVSCIFRLRVVNIT